MKKTKKLFDSATTKAERDEYTDLSDQLQFKYDEINKQIIHTDNASVKEASPSDAGSEPPKTEEKQKVSKTKRSKLKDKSKTKVRNCVYFVLFV